MPPAPAPAHVALIREFANTLDVEDGSDALDSPSGLTGWLRERGLLPAAAPAAARDDVDAAQELRRSIRAALVSHDAPDVESGAGTPEAEAIAARLPLRLSFTGAEPRLVPAVGGVPGALAAVLVAVNDAVADGTWVRLKICPADDCAFAFYDSSKNRSKTWCDMRVCGNRQKTRAYRARHRAADGSS